MTRLRIIKNPESSWRVALENSKPDAWVWVRIELLGCRQIDGSEYHQMVIQRKAGTWSI